MQNCYAMLRTSALTVALCLNGMAHAQQATSQNARAANYTFNADRLAFPVDLQMYAEGNPVLPGVHRVDVHMNDEWFGKFDVHFASMSPNDRVAQPCFSAELLEALGFDDAHYTPEALARLQTGEALCGNMAQIVAGASASFDTGQQKLMVSAPQAVLLRLPRGYVNPKRWEAGINAATLSYNYNGYSSQMAGGSTQTNHYLHLRFGMNLGAWRFRYRGAFNRQPGEQMTHMRDAVYFERAVPGLKSRFVIGDAPTSGHVFDSLSLRGAQLVTDTRMRPDSQGNFVPIINGVAQSNARVTVEQRGQQIFEMTVPPGPFVIDDLYPNGRGGDLTVTITEADGTQRSFDVTYANLPEMLRPGVVHYSAAVGRYHDRHLFEDAHVLGMLTGSYGFNNTVTGYGGVMAAQGYHALSLGAGLNLPVGAVTADITWANARGLRETTRGYAFRLGYTKLIPQIESDVTLAMYRYATQGYYEPAQTFQLRSAYAGGMGSSTLDKRRHQFALRISHQPRDGWLSLNAGASVQDYWNRPGRDVQYHVGFGRSFGMVNVGLNINRSRNVLASRWENQYTVNLSIPLGGGASNYAYLNSSYAWQNDAHVAQTSLSGSIGEQHQIGYGLFASGNKHKGSSRQRSVGGNLSMTTSVARLGVTASTGSGGNRQVSLSASGGVLAFDQGVLVAADLGDTVGIVHAENAAGARLQNHPSVALNKRGYALVPYLQPYRENDVVISPKGASTDVEMTKVNQKAVPMDGAVVLLNYETRQGYAVLLQGQRRDGSALPFGAGVLNADGRNIGYVAQGGQALIRADAPVGTMTVRWGPGADQRCQFDYDLRSQIGGESSETSDFRRLEVVCS